MGNPFGDLVHAGFNQRVFHIDDLVKS